MGPAGGSAGGSKAGSKAGSTGGSTREVNPNVMRLYSAALDRTLLARAECVRAERPWMRRWRAAGERMMRAVDRSAWRRLEPGAGDEELLAQTLLEVRACAPRGAPRPRVMHVIGSLAAGGAERQVVYTARETKRCGAADAEIVVLNPLEGAARHYLPLAESGGVAVRVGGCGPGEGQGRMGGG